MLKNNFRIISGGDITAQIAPCVKSIRYSDSLKNESDSCEIVLADPTQVFLRKPPISKNNEVKVEFIGGNFTLHLGTFNADEISYKMNPCEMTIKLNSLSQDTKLRGIEKNRSWEMVNLSKVCSDIANDAGLKLIYQVKDDPEIKRLEQSQQPDLEFLSGVCRNYALALKIHDKKMVIFDEADYEKRGAVKQIVNGDGNILDFRGNTTANDIYEGASVSYMTNGINEWLFGGFSFGGILGDLIKNFENSGELPIFERVDSVAESEKLASSRLHEKNKKETTIDFKTIGSFDLLAGNTIEIAGYGIYDGKYLIDRADHTMNDGGYITSINGHKAQ